MYSELSVNFHYVNVKTFIKYKLTLRIAKQSRCQGRHYIYTHTHTTIIVISRYKKNYIY